MTITTKHPSRGSTDRWENEGGRIAADTTTPNDTKATSEDKGRAKKRSSQPDNPTLASPTKRRKPTGK